MYVCMFGESERTQHFHHLGNNYFHVPSAVTSHNSSTEPGKLAFCRTSHVHDKMVERSCCFLTIKGLTFFGNCFVNNMCESLFISFLPSLFIFFMYSLYIIH